MQVVVHHKDGLYNRFTGARIVALLVISLDLKRGVRNYVEHLAAFRLLKFDRSLAYEFFDLTKDSLLRSFTLER